MKCLNCHTTNSDRLKFCLECGDPLTMSCPRCKMPVLSIQKFCGECGQKLNPASGKPASPLNEIGGERKHVTVLFSDLSGYTALSSRLDPEEVRDISSHLFAQIAKIIAGYQGFIEKFVGDAVLAIFGLPAVHEDDPMRAVRSAMEIHKFVKSISPKFRHRIGQRLCMHSGIHTGLVVTGEMIVEQGIHGVVGETLNLASRLADIAEPDEVLLSSQTNNLISPYFETTPLPRIALKGIAKAITPHRIVGELKVKTRFDAAKRHGFTTFIGRSKELARLRSGIEKIIAGKGQFVTVSGEAGVGKSRLAYEFRHRIDNRRINVLQGRCQSYGGNTPYLPFLNALKRGLSLNENDTHSQLEQKAIANTLAIDASLEQYLPLLLHLLSIPSKKYRLPGHLHGQALKNSINQALAAIILLNARRKPMVLVLEDWHWVDEASDSLLLHLAGLMESYPLMLMVLYRPEAAKKWPDWNFHSACILKSMDYPNTAQIIKSIWKVDALPAGFSSFVHDHTGGNPFFIEEVCRSLTEDGSIRITKHHAVLIQSAEQLRLPDTVQAVIRARIDRLGSHMKETLQLAAVIGREFTLRILERISGAGHRLSETLEVLNAQELIQQVRLLPEAEYMFMHVLTQVAVYESLLLKKRKAVHAFVGLAMEQVYADRLEEQCENLAHHYANSTNAEKALFYLKMAGSKAARVHSLTEARKYYETALSILDAGEESSENQQLYIDLTLKWADVSQYAPSNKTRTALIKSLNYAKQFNRRNRIAQVSYWVGRFGYMQGDFVEAIPHMENCIQWAGELDDRELLGISYNLAGRACFYTSEYAKGITYLNKGIELIKPFERWDDIVYSTAILGILAGLTGNLKFSLKAIATAIRTARKREIRTFEAMAFGYLGSIHYWYGNWRASINNCRKCIEISKKLGNSLPIIWATLFNGAALFDSGEQEDGLAIMDQSIEKLRNMDSVLALRFFNSLYAEKLAIRGNYKKAQSINQRAIALSDCGQKWGEVAIYRTTAILAAAEKQPDWHRVIGQMEKSIEISTRSGAITEQVTSLFCFSDLLNKKGDTDQASACYHQGKMIAEKIGRRVH
jgi:class 3 adenylate cyclase/tetratricopeptide (TPR) repeat protein